MNENLDLTNEKPRILRNVQSQAIADAGQDAINAILTLVDRAEAAEAAVQRVREVAASSNKLHSEWILEALDGGEQK